MSIKVGDLVTVHQSLKYSHAYKQGEVGEVVTFCAPDDPLGIAYFVLDDGFCYRADQIRYSPLLNVARERSSNPGEVREVTSEQLAEIISSPTSADFVFKDSNPKDALGIKKVPLSTVPAPVLAEIGVGMLEGARKYGRHNYRIVGVRGSVYYDAALRHLMSWYEGEDTDPDSGLSHITKAMASLVVLRDAMIQDKFVDDRPPKSPEGWMKELQPVIDGMFEKYPECEKVYLEGDQN